LPGRCRSSISAKVHSGHAYPVTLARRQIARRPRDRGDGRISDRRDRRILNRYARVGVKALLNEARLLGASTKAENGKRH
jgi:hypothetical protein